MRMRAVIGIALVALLAGCGGGGDDAPAASTSTATAEGFYQGQASTGTTVRVAILENGETWGFYTTSSNALAGALHGQTTWSANSLSGAGRDFNIPNRTVTSATYTGTFVQKSSVSITTSGGVAFNGTYKTEYDRPATLASLAGTFTGFALTGSTAPSTVSATISSTGAITVPASGGCSASGTATPRATGKNVFNVRVTFSGTCALGNGTIATGIAYYDTASREVVVMAMNPAKSDGFIYVGTK